MNYEFGYGVIAGFFVIVMAGLLGWGGWGVYRMARDLTRSIGGLKGIAPAMESLLKWSQGYREISERMVESVGKLDTTVSKLSETIAARGKQGEEEPAGFIPYDERERWRTYEERMKVRSGTDADVAKQQVAEEDRYHDSLRDMMGIE